ncbi:mCG148142 [Mus musculus]|nr:mCG148142 [Mus musculus]
MGGLRTQPAWEDSRALSGEKTKELHRHSRLACPGILFCGVVKNSIPASPEWRSRKNSQAAAGGCVEQFVWPGLHSL